MNLCGRNILSHYALGKRPIKWEYMSSCRKIWHTICGWFNLFHLYEPTYKEACIEFFIAYNFQQGVFDPKLPCIAFQLRGIQHNYIPIQFAVVVVLHQCWHSKSYFLLFSRTVSNSSILSMIKLCNEIPFPMVFTIQRSTRKPNSIIQFTIFYVVLFSLFSSRGRRLTK